MKNFLIFYLLLTGISSVKAENIKIVSSINPIYQIVKSINSNNQSFLLVNSNISGHDYMLRPSDFKKVSQADIIFYIDDNLESYLSKIIKNNKKATIVKLIDVDNLKLLKDKFGKIDPHIWLNPENAIIIAQIVANNLERIDPNNGLQYRNNLKKFTEEVFVISKKIKSNLQEIKDKNYLTYHNGSKYFEDYFDFSSLGSISKYHHQRLSAKDMKEIAHIIRNKRVKCIFGQPQEESNVALKIAKSNNIKFAIIDLIGNEDQDYIKTLENISINISECLN